VCCRYLAAKCLAEVEEWDECLTLLGDGELDDDLQDAVRQAA
jgi:anaphase-promoting complex subunit 6